MAIMALPFAASAQTVGRAAVGKSTQQSPGASMPSVHARGRVDILVHAGASANLVPGYSNIDKKGNMNCDDPSGCLITISTEFVITGSTGALYEVCTLVDGQAAQPPCEDDQQQYFTSTTLQSIVVAAGKHTVQTQFYDEGQNGTLGGWEISYTQYRLGNDD
jgi:hypothetical protein